MPWCPKCKGEFREGFTECRNCSTQLVDQLEDEFEEKAPSDAKHEVNEEWAILINLKDDIEADSITALMDSCGIPVVRKHNDWSTLSNVYTGKSNFGADLYVPISRLEEAKELLNTKVDIDEEQFEEEINEEYLTSEQEIQEQEEDQQEYEVAEADTEEFEKDLEGMDVYTDGNEKVVYNKNRKLVAWLLLAIIGIPSLIGIIYGILVYMGLK